MQKDHLALHPASTGAAETDTRGAPAVTKRGAIAAAVIGNWLEFFDFTVYGFFAVLIGKRTVPCMMFLSLSYVPSIKGLRGILCFTGLHVVHSNLIFCEVDSEIWVRNLTPNYV